MYEVSSICDSTNRDRYQILPYLIMIDNRHNRVGAVLQVQTLHYISFYLSQARLHVRTGAVDKSLHCLSSLLGALGTEEGRVLLTQGTPPTEEEQEALHLMVRRRASLYRVIRYLLSCISCCMFGCFCVSCVHHNTRKHQRCSKCSYG